MKYVIEKTGNGQNPTVGYVVWEESDYPKRELLKHPVPENYVGTSESKYLLELFELSWSDGKYVPKGYIPLYNRLPQTETQTLEHEITSFGNLDYATATRLIFKSTFDRFGIKYYNTSLGDSIFAGLDKLSIPFLAHKELIPQDIDSVYYFALMFKHELFNKISLTGIYEILQASETKNYPKDENGYLDILSLIKFSKVFTKTNWTVSPNSEKIKTEWNPYIVAPTHWIEFYELYLHYGQAGLIALSNNLELSDIKRVMKVAEMFEIDDVDELIELHKTVPQEWLQKFSPIMNEPPF